MRVGPNKCVVKHHYAKPYNMWIMDDLLSTDEANAIRREWDDMTIDADHGWHAGYDTINGEPNVLEQGIWTFNDISRMPPTIQRVMKRFHSPAFVQQLGVWLNLHSLCVDETQRWSNMRYMVPGAHQLIHSDACQHPQNGLTKLLTCLLYVAPDDYDAEQDGGALEVWSDDMKTCVRRIEPRHNRFVVFVNGDKSHHGVPHVGRRPRRCLTFSVMTKLQHSAHRIRTKARFLRRPNDPKEIETLGQQRAIIPDDVGTQPWKPPSDK